MNLIEVAKKLHEISIKVKEASVREAIVNGHLALLDAREQIAALREQIHELQTKLAEYENPSFQIRDGVIWRSDPHGCLHGYCPACRSSKAQWNLLQDYGHSWRCPVCKVRFVKPETSGGSGGLGDRE